MSSGRERCTQPEQHVRATVSATSRRSWLELPGVDADRSQRQSETKAEAGGRHKEHRERDGVSPHTVADDEQRHGHRVGHQSDDEHPLETDAPGERRKRQRAGDGEDHLRQEEEPVLGGGGRSYAAALVRTVAAAGTATRLSPWKSRAAYTATTSDRRGPGVLTGRLVHGLRPHRSRRSSYIRSGSNAEGTSLEGVTKPLSAVASSVPCPLPDST